MTPARLSGWQTVTLARVTVCDRWAIHELNCGRSVTVVVPSATVAVTDRNGEHALAVEVAVGDLASFGEGFTHRGVGC